MGQIARLDLYTDVCFMVLVLKCRLWIMFIPDITSIMLTLAYPLFMLVKLLKVRKSLSHTMPKIERNCKLSFIREQMLLATVLDSVSLTNYETIFGR
jgi:hypothetical protein